MQIKRVGKNEREKAIGLVLSTFMQYEAPDYCEEGIEAFKNSVIYNEEYQNNIVIYAAYEKDILLGVIATRNNGNHISLFFVEGKYHRQGVGKRLFHTVVENTTSREITVNSSPYAVEVYHHLGFTDTAPEQITDGIRYTPMKYLVKE